MGAQTAIPAEQLTPDVLARVANGAFLPMAGGTMAIVRRPGLATYRQSTETQANTYVIAPYSAAPAFILVLSTGTVKNFTTSGETNLTIPASLTVSGSRQQAVVVGDTIYFVNILAGSTTYNWKVRSATTILPYGIDTPGNAPTAASAGAGTPNGTYSFLITWYNSSSAVESSPSASVSYTTSGAENITVNRNNTTPPDGVDFWRLYVRKTGLQGSYYLSTTSAVATTTLTFTQTDAQLTALTTVAPDSNANNPPPELRTHCWHLNRMFGGDDQYLYWSNIDAPSNWNPANAILVGNKDEGEVTALWSLGVDRLLIGKHGAFYVLEGDSPQNWVLGRVYDGWGIRSALAIAEGAGQLGFISSQGPAVMPTSLGGPPKLLTWTSPLGDYAMRGTDETEWGWWVVFDPEGSRFLFPLVNGLGSPVRWTIASWSTVHACWEGLWDIPAVTYSGGVYTPAPVWSAASTPVIGVGGTSLPGRAVLGLGAGTVAYLQQQYQTDAAANSTGSSLAYNVETGGTSAAISITGAGTFPVRTTVPSRVTIVDGTTGKVEQRQYTSSGTATKTITFASTLSFTPAADSVAIFDMPVTEVDSGAFGGEDHARKRALMGYVGVNTDGDSTFHTFVLQDGSETASRGFRSIFRRNRPTEFHSNPADLTGTVPLLRQRIGLVGQFFRWRVVGWSPISRWAITKMAMKVARWSR